MGNEFLDHLQQKAREPDEPMMQPPIDCPRCAALVLVDHLERHMDYHVRNEHK